MFLLLKLASFYYLFIMLDILENIPMQIKFSNYFLPFYTMTVLRNNNCFADHLSVGFYSYIYTSNLTIIENFEISYYFRRRKLFLLSNY